MSAGYLLDTNVLSELVKRQPNAAVERRLAALQFHCAVAAPTLEELTFGIQRLPPGAKREMLEFWLDGVLSHFVLLPYDHYCAVWLGRERARLAALGKPAPRTDGEIAAIAVVNERILVTRNTADFENFLGLRLENWF